MTKDQCDIWCVFNEVDGVKIMKYYFKEVTAAITKRNDVLVGFFMGIPQRYNHHKQLPLQLTVRH